MKNLKVYLAGGWFTKSQDEINTKLENYLMSKDGIDVYRPRHDGVKLGPNEFHDPKLREKVFLDNVKNIEEADFIVTNLDGREGFLDTGTVWEDGYAMARGIPIIAYQDDENGKLKELIGTVSNGFLSICTSLNELDETINYYLTQVKNYPKVDYSYKKGTKVLYISPDNTEENISKSVEAANVLIECCGKDFRWVDKLSKIDLSKTIDSAFDDVEYMIAVIDDRNPIVSWMMGQAYARKIPVISYTNYDHGVNIMLLCSIVTHIKGTSNLKETVQLVKRDGIKSLGEFDSSNIKAF